MWKSLPLACLVLGSTVPLAFAQDADQQDDLPEINPGTEDRILVTGTRFRTPLDRIGRSVSVITADDIEIRQQRFVFDTLQALPGVQVIRSGSFGALASVSIRGLPSDQTLVVQDGVVLNNPASFGNGFNFANFDTSDIQQIEVLRGAQSTLYGSDAIGGVINIVTRDGREGFEADGFLEAGSFGTFRGAATVLGGTERLSGRLTLSGVTTGGFSSADEINGNTEDDGFDNITVSSKIRYAPLESVEAVAVVRYQDSENEFDSFAGMPIDGDEIGETEEISVAGFATHTALDGRLENRLSITYLRNEQLNLSDGIVSFDSIGTRISYEYQSTYQPIEAVAVIAGVEYEEQESAVAAGFGANAEIETISGYGLVQLRPVPFVTLNGGVRHDAFSGFDGETTFSVSAALEMPATRTIFRGSFADGFRAPSAGELSFNPELFPEVSEGWDVGVEQPLFGDRLRLRAIYFDQQIDDLIAFDLEAFTFINIQTFDTQGVEVSAEAFPMDGLSISAAYTYTDALNLSTEIAAGNQPDNRFNIEVAYQPTSKFSLSAGVTFNGTEIDGAQTLDSFTLVNLRGDYQVGEGLNLFVRIENAIDATYQDNFGFGTAPISAFGGLRVRI